MRNPDYKFPFLIILLAVSCAVKTEPATPTPVGIFEPTVNPEQKEFYVAPDGRDSNPGTLDAPWATPNHAAQVLQAGQTVYLREGTYLLLSQIKVKNSGEENAWITYTVYPGELALLDADNIPVGPPSGVPPFPHDQGAFQIEKVQYIRVIELALKNSHNAGFMVRDSSHIELVNNIIDTTFSPGIGVWDTNHDRRGTENIKILGNTVTNANTWDMVIPGFDGSEPPHEAISIAGAQNFEVAYNYIFDSDKEGIDVKEVSSHGLVHHNYIRNVDRQGLYADSWFGVLEDVEFYANVVEDCHGAGIAISVEGGQIAQNIRIHHNLFFNNLGTGIFFSRWGGDGKRKDIQVYNNTLYRNGCGSPNPGEAYYWITGGVYLYSTNLENIAIRNNILSQNCAFQIGYNEEYTRVDKDIRKTFEQKQIKIDHNLIHQIEAVKYPVRVGWPPNDYANVNSFLGNLPAIVDPLFIDPFRSDFRLQTGSTAINRGSSVVENADPDGSPVDLGAFYFGYEEGQWWKNNFPPILWQDNK